jgi:hypothetical protein
MLPAEAKAPAQDIVPQPAEEVKRENSESLAEAYEASSVTRKEADKLNQPTPSETAHDWYTKLVDRFHPIKQAIDFVEKVKGEKLAGSENGYTLAMNSLNASTIANFLLTENMTDMDGNIIGQSFMAALKDVSAKDIKAFESYLKNRHALDWLEPKDGAKPKVVYARNLKNAGI